MVSDKLDDKIQWLQEAEHVRSQFCFIYYEIEKRRNVAKEGREFKEDDPGIETPKKWMDQAIRRRSVREEKNNLNPLSAAIKRASSFNGMISESNEGGSDLKKDKEIKNERVKSASSINKGRSFIKNLLRSRSSCQMTDEDGVSIMSLNSIDQLE